MSPARARQSFENSANNDVINQAQDFRNKGEQSIATNPYFFSAPFSGVLVAPAAYMFVINLMSNHSAAEPNGQ